MVASIFLINGESCELVSVQDRGLHYGDGIFETVAVHNHQPLSWSAHLHRLQNGCERLGIKCPDAKTIESEVRQLSSAVSPSVIKIIVTRGPGGRGYRVPETETPSRIVASYPWPEYGSANYNPGIVARICSTRLGRNKQLAGIKHLNRLEQVLARMEWSEPGIAEGIMLDDQGHVMEGTMSNLFMVRTGQLLTPDLAECGVAGITRANILELAPALDIPVVITQLTLEDLLLADEIFLCNSVIGIWPVRRIAEHCFVHGPISGKIRHALSSANMITPV